MPLYHSFQTRPGGRSGPRAGFRVLTRSSGRPGQFFFNQNDVILVKKKSQRVATRFLTRSCRVTGSTCRINRVFSFPIFSSTRPGSSLGSAWFRIDPPGRAGFQNYTLYFFSYNY